MGRLSAGVEGEGEGEGMREGAGQGDGEGECESAGAGAGNSWESLLGRVSLPSLSALSLRFFLLLQATKSGGEPSDTVRLGVRAWDRGRSSALTPFPQFRKTNLRSYGLEQAGEGPW
jgi:hypothetical protein